MGSCCISVHTYTQIHRRRKVLENEAWSAKHIHTHAVTHLLKNTHINFQYTQTQTRRRGPKSEAWSVKHACIHKQSHTSIEPTTLTFVDTDTKRRVLESEAWSWCMTHKPPHAITQFHKNMLTFSTYTCTHMKEGAGEWGLECDTHTHIQSNHMQPQKHINFQYTHTHTHEGGCQRVRLGEWHTHTHTIKSYTATKTH